MNTLRKALRLRGYQESTTEAIQKKKENGQNDTEVILKN